METLKEAYIRHDQLANDLMFDAQQLKALAPAGADGRKMREVASVLKMRGNALRRAASTLLNTSDRLTEDAAGLFIQIDAQSLIWTGINLSTNPVEFEDCDFSNVVFTDCDLRSVTFTHCDLRGARFVRTNVAGLRLVDCDVDGLWFGNEEEFKNARFGSPTDNAFCWNGGYIGALTRGVIHSGCTGQAIGLEHIADTGFTGYGSSADYRASRND